MNKFITPFFLFLFLMPVIIFSQNENNIITKEDERKKRAIFSTRSSGLTFSNLRDFATSPLIYNGISYTSTFSLLKINTKREMEIGTTNSLGIFSTSINGNGASGYVFSPSVFYSQLYELHKLSSEKLNIKIGGLFNTTANIRYNASYNNNAFGLEIIPTLFGSIKLTKDVSRKETKNKKILGIPYTLKARKRDISFRLNIGLVNSSYRNGYVYADQSSLLNDFTLFEDYQFKIFSGFRMSSSLDYTIYLKNRNRMQFSYVWDAYKTGGDLDKLEVGNHSFRYTFLINHSKK